MLVIKRSWCKNPEAQTPLSVDTNTCPSRRTTNVPFVLMLPQKSAFVAWHHRDTSNTQTGKVGQNLWASYGLPDLEYAENSETFKLKT